VKEINTNITKSGATKETGKIIKKKGKVDSVLNELSTTP
jgi:hypothetical protein